MPSQEERKYIVWGILIAGLFGFLINILASFAYTIFIVGDVSWHKINQFNFYFCLVSLIGVIGYLMFFIHDHPNSPEISKAYWKRYINYFFYKFGPGKILRVVMGIYLLLLLVGFLILLYYIFGKTLGYPFATIVACTAFILANIKEIITKRKHA